MANRTPAIRTAGLEKRYGTTRALRGLDLVVAEGTILSVLGPNGAGKTALVRILSTLLRPDAGRAEVAGFDHLTARPLELVAAAAAGLAAVRHARAGRSRAGGAAGLRTHRLTTVRARWETAADHPLHREG